MHHDHEDIRAAVRNQYGQVAQSSTSKTDASCGTGCCTLAFPPEASLALGYSAEELAAVPDGANMGLGCGNPQAIAGLSPGETVIDLGAGGGFDCFLAAKQVGPEGRVIGVDMTAEMVSKARANAKRADANNVEFRLGEIEHLPVADDQANVIISNCVVNLSPDKPAVFREAFRVLAPGGRIAISDVVALGPLPDSLQDDIEALTGCIAGAAQVSDVERMLADAGFESVEVRVRPESRDFIANWLPGRGLEDHVASATIEAKKPGGDSCCEPACCTSESAE